jgi:hypothetical protein
MTRAGHPTKHSRTPEYRTDGGIAPYVPFLDTGQWPWPLTSMRALPAGRYSSRHNTTKRPPRTYVWGLEWDHIDGQRTFCWRSTCCRCYMHCTLLVSPIAAATPRRSSESAAVTGIDDTQTRSFMMQRKKTIGVLVFLVPIG